MNPVVAMIALCLFALPLASPAKSEMHWINFPDAGFVIDGLPWFTNNTPELWRLPKDARSKVPIAVWKRAVAPDGGRIRFSSNTSRLALKVEIMPGTRKPCFFDVYTNGVFAGAAKGVSGPKETELIPFETENHDPKEITIYLPNNHEVRVGAIGLDGDAVITTPKPFALNRPIVCYGSSVLQGTGADHPSKTYPAILARQLQLDFVNLGFGGAGKAEPEVVELVNQLDASCFIFDLGKSYGDQPMAPYLRMLETIRATHPMTPVVCITPIYSTKEVSEPGYRDKSEKLRALMRNAALERKKSGDKHIFVVEGLELFGKADNGLFDDPLHPNDDGNERIAARLAPLVSKILSQKSP